MNKHLRTKSTHAKRRAELVSEGPGRKNDAENRKRQNMMYGCKRKKERKNNEPAVAQGAWPCDKIDVPP